MAARSTGPSSTPNSWAQSPSLAAGGRARKRRSPRGGRRSYVQGACRSTAWVCREARPDVAAE
eukprot:10151784-Alexandrium_andersonii.AAC.1